MKEATGELNMTVVTVVAIAAIAAFFYTVVWPGIKESIEAGQKCASAICSDCSGNKCSNCVMPDGSNGPKNCPNKNSK